MVKKNADANLPVINKEQELAKYEPRYKSLILDAKDLKVIDEETKKKAIDSIRELNLLSDNYQKLLDHLVKPLKIHVKNLEADIKPYIKAIEQLVGKDSYQGLRGQLADYETKMEEKRRKEEEKLRIEQQKRYEKEVEKSEKKGEIAPPPPPPVIVQAEKEAGVSYSDKWTYDETKVEIEKVPEVFGGVRLKVLDGKAVQKLIEAGCREIPGIPIFCKKIPIIREQRLEDL